MARRWALSGVAVLVVGVAAAGCGSSASTSTSSAGATAAASASVSTTSTGVLRTAPAPLPAGTPAAPAGLAQTGGYDTYELCHGHCTGAVPASLRRPLHLPRSAGARCSAPNAESPVSVSGGRSLAAQHFIGSRWLAARVTWRATRGYGGPILIRGRRLAAGSAAVGFGEGREPYDELQLMSSGRGAATHAAGVGRAWLSLTRVRQPGCYAYQVDGTNFSKVIVFRVSARRA